MLDFFCWIDKRLHNESTSVQPKQAGLKKCFGWKGKEPLIERNLSENDTLSCRLASTVGHRQGESRVVTL